jgi:hypothetical protein
MSNGHRVNKDRISVGDTGGGPHDYKAIDIIE